MLIRNKKDLPHQWKESIVPIHEMGDKTDCSNYRGISLMSTSYNILSNFLLCRLIPYAGEIVGDHQCVFRRNSSTTDQFSISVRYWRKSGSKMAQYISYLYISRKPMIQLGGKHYTRFSLSLEYPGNYWGKLKCV
jgi:hypothetical protein